MVVHKPCKGQRECLTTDYHIPTHHKDPEQNQQQGDYRSPDGQFRQDQQDKGYQVAEAILEDKNIDEVFSIHHRP